MLRQNSSSIGPNHDRPDPSPRSSPEGSEGLALKRQLQQLEEIILDSPRVPLTHRTLVDEDRLLDYLDQVRLNLPGVFQEAEEILQSRAAILAQAQEYAQGIIKAAEQRAAQIADELRIVQQAELEAQRIRQGAQQECEAVRQSTSAEIERVHRQVQQELEEMRRATLKDCEQLQLGADTYADRVLTDMEQQLSEVLRVVHNSRNHLRETSVQVHVPQEVICCQTS